MGSRRTRSKKNNRDHCQGKAELDKKTGVILDYEVEDRAKDLLLEYCRFARDGVLNEFSKAYAPMIKDLIEEKGEPMQWNNRSYKGYSPQTYNDGTLKIYKKMNVAEDGDMPDEQLILQDKLRYEEQTLGVTRYFAAMQNKKRSIEGCSLSEARKAHDCRERLANCSLKRWITVLYRIHPMAKGNNAKIDGFNTSEIGA